MSIAVSTVLIVASFRTCLARVSEQQHLPLLVGPCGDLEMSAKSCLAENTVRPTENGVPQQGQISTNDGLLPPSHYCMKYVQT